MKRQFFIGVLAAVVWCGSVACGGGVPITVRIDDPNFAIDIDALMVEVDRQLPTLLPGNPQGYPEYLPPGLPEIGYSKKFQTEPYRVDLSQPKYKNTLEKYGDALQRIELNHLVIRLEQNTTNIAFPALRLLLADEADASVDDLSAWKIVGVMPSAPAGEVADVAFRFMPGGETFFNEQVGDETKAFALRAEGNLEFDARLNRERPRGKVLARVIAEVTIFVDPSRIVDEFY